MSALNAEVRELAEAIRDALDVPVADSREPGAETAEDMLRLKRACYVRGVLCGLAAGTGTVSDTVNAIRAAGPEFPVTYTVRQRAEVGS